MCETNLKGAIKQRGSCCRWVAGSASDEFLKHRLYSGFDAPLGADLGPETQSRSD